VNAAEWPIALRSLHAMALLPNKSSLLARQRKDKDLLVSDGAFLLHISGDGTLRFCSAMMYHLVHVFMRLS
jgi:hypothetical protein